MALITKDSQITEVLQNHPESYDVFSKYNVGCVGCMLAAFETLEQGLSAHGVDVDAFVKDLNDAISK